MNKRFERRTFLGSLGALTSLGLVGGDRLLSPAVAVPSSHAMAVLHRGIVDSRFFRIPFLLATQSGGLIVGSDANRSTTGDSADNIDAVIRVKSRASEGNLAEGWSIPHILAPIDMKDFASNSEYAQESASVIDGAIVQDRGTGRILLLIDLFAWNGGVFEHLNVLADRSVRGGRTRSFPLGDGFANVSGRPMLLLSTQNVTGDADGKTGNINLNTDRSKFAMVADLDGPRDADGRVRVFNLVGTPRPYGEAGVDDSNLSLGEPTGFTLDNDFVVHRHGQALTVPQVGTSVAVPMRVFYKKSVLQVYNTSHIAQVFSDDDGQTWQMGRLVTHEFRSPDSRYSLLAPGRCIQIEHGVHAGRLVVPTYTQMATGIEAVAVVSDDGGARWTRGEPVPSDVAMHETAIIEAAPGVLRSFHRHAASTGGKVLSAESLDGGMTWSKPQSAFGDLGAGVSCQVSALSLRQRLVSKETGERLPAIVVITPMDRARKNGMAHLGVVHTAAGGDPRTRVEWISSVEISDPMTLFAYSSVDQLQDGRLLVLFESSTTQSWADGLQAMYLQEIPLP